MIHTQAKLSYNVDMPKINKNCELCDTAFSVYPCNIKQRFCSSKCRAKVIMPTGGYFKPGFTPWNKGVKGWNEMHANAGFQKGDKNPSWKGGVAKERDKDKFKHRVWRSFIFERDNYTCQMCYKRGGRLEADHIKCYAHFPELRFDTDNGRTLCYECHKTTTNYGSHKREACIQ